VNRAGNLSSKLLEELPVNLRRKFRISNEYIQCGRCINQLQQF